MKKLLMRCVAVMSLCAGFWMLAVPAWAAYKACITDGGNHEISWSSCRPGENAVCDGDCGWKRWAKGYYCAGTTDQFRCADKPNVPVDVYRRDSQCILHTVGGNIAGCSCSLTAYVTNWYLSTEKEEAGACETSNAQ